MAQRMAGSMASGMATGAGMAMASRAVDSIMGPRQVEMVHSQGEGQAQQAPQAPQAPQAQQAQQACIPISIKT